MKLKLCVYVVGITGAHIINLAMGLVHHRPVAIVRIARYVKKDYEQRQKATISLNSMAVEN